MKLPAYNICYVIALQAAHNVPEALAAKPVKQLVLAAESLKFDIQLLLGDLWLQLDQTGDASHQQALSSRYTVCTPATAAEKAACRSNCHKENDGDPTLLKMCIDCCNANHDCSQTCGDHKTAIFVKWGGAMKQVLYKNCTNPADTCPRCTQWAATPLVEDYDATYLVPNPVVVQDVGVGSDSCRLTRFSINLPIRGDPDYSALVAVDLSAAQGLHINIKATADSPSMRCTGALPIDATFQNPNFDLYFKPSVVNHRAAWAASASFHTHVSYIGDWLKNIDDTVTGKVNGILNGWLASNQAAISKGLTGWLADQIKTNYNDNIDDITAITVTPTTLTISYTPKCIDGSGCAGTCETSCDGAHYCEPNFWDDPSPRAKCTAGQVCLASGTCCSPRCGPDRCGDVGCGKSCGACGSGLICKANTCVSCNEGSCNHICKKTSCGTWCGTCKPGFFCDTGGCKDSRLRRGLAKGGRRVGSV